MIELVDKMTVKYIQKGGTEDIYLVLQTELCPPNLYVEAPVPNVMVFGDDP